MSLDLSGARHILGLTNAGALQEINWKIALGDTALSVCELERLARLEAPLVKMRGQ